jgi:hypothetical protein
MTVNVPTPSQPGAGRRRRIQVAAGLAVIPLVTVLAACGSSSGATVASAPATQGPSQGSNSGAAGGAPAIPGASGLIAAVSPGTLQVQSATAQNTVVYTATTKFTTITAGHLAAGDCVTVTGTPGVGSAKALTATSVRIDAKVNDACPATGGGVGGGGFGGAGSYSSRPSGAPSRAPSGGGSAARRAFASATGTVSSVSGSTILVSGVLRGRAGATSSATAPTASTITVTLAASATVTQTVAATSAAAVLGKCATAIGPANSAGAITAKSITISTPGPTGCSAGFGGFGGRGGGSGGAGGTGSSPAAGTGSNA